ncbi:PIG-L family deacetylase [Kocuria flava]|uniref:PIG-L family deacetylase n=1 Tax=Kocuria flava TaxID=446860 RepID=UPI002151D3E8|nr:PIG-L family deacetylase [Kocuria flava]
MTQPVPQYPEQGALVREDALPGLLPAGLRPEDARLLFVHAHPDDESIATGATMGHYALLGAQVVLLTMTRGERGEVVPEPLRHLEAERAGDGGTALGLYRVGELDDAAAALGVTDRFFAGEPPARDGSAELPATGGYTDSGMAWGADGRAGPAEDSSPHSLTAADPGTAAAHVAAAVRALRPHVLVTYDDDGGYGHPDHVRTHEVAVRAVALAARPGAGGDAWSVPLVWAAEGEPRPGDPRPQAAVHGSAERKRAAMAAHATQLVLDADGTRFALSNGVWQPFSALETYRLLGGDRRRAEPPAGDAAAAAPPGAGPGAPEPGTPRAGSAAVPRRDADPPATVASAVATSVLAGLLGGSVATVLHGSIWYSGTGWWLPWGLAFGAALLLCLSVWAGTATRRVWAAAVPGLVAYVLAWLLARGRDGSALVVTVPDAPIGVVGVAWFVVVLATTLLSVLVTARWVRTRRRELRTA